MFAAETLNELLAAVGAEQFRVLKVVLPVGISFYTFHSLTYIIDLYRGHATPAKSFTDFSGFVALFPDLVAGPIIRYKTLAEQLASRTHLVSRFASGIVIFVLGFAKMVLQKKSCWQIQLDTSLTPLLTLRIHCLWMRGSDCWHMPSKSTSTFVAIPTWPWGWDACWDLNFQEILIRLTVPLMSPIFGVAGTFRFRPYCGTTYICHSAATGKDHRALM
jgi:hypothetical protein